MPVVHQAEGRRLGVRAVAAGQRLGVDLGERALAKLAPQPGRAVEDGVGAALGMGDHHAEAAVAQLGGRQVEVLADALEGRLDQQPAAVRRALGDRLQLELGEAPDHVVAELAAAAHADRDALGVDRGLKLLHALAERRARR